MLKTFLPILVSLGASALLAVLFFINTWFAVRRGVCVVPSPFRVLVRGAEARRYGVASAILGLIFVGVFGIVVMTAARAGVWTVVELYQLGISTDCTLAGVERIGADTRFVRMRCPGKCEQLAETLIRRKRAERADKRKDSHTLVAPVGKTAAILTLVDHSDGFCHVLVSISPKYHPAVLEEP